MFYSENIKHMKLLEFQYTKSDGKTSVRSVLVTQEPSKHIAGIDLSELDTDSFESFTREMRQLKELQYQQTLELMAKHDLKHNYRQFLPERMTRVETVWV
jgi:hypothetical protein